MTDTARLLHPACHCYCLQGYVVQMQAAKLGVVTGKHLAEHCRSDAWGSNAWRGGEEGQGKARQGRGEHIRAGPSGQVRVYKPLSPCNLVCTNPTPFLFGPPHLCPPLFTRPHPSYPLRPPPPVVRYHPCREQYPPTSRYILWIMAELALIGSDIQVRCAEYCSHPTQASAAAAPHLLGRLTGGGG